MKRISIGFLITFLLITIFSACKEDNYIDWKVKNELWLENNKTQAGVETTASGLQYKILDQGRLSDRKPSKTSYVNLKYIGNLVDGSKFDNGVYTDLLSRSPLSGFIEGVTKIHDGGSIILYIPSDLAYGKAGSGTTIPSHSTLIFQIDLNYSDQ